MARDRKNAGKNPSAASPLTLKPEPEPGSRSEPESQSAEPKALEGAGKSYALDPAEGQIETDASASDLGLIISLLAGQSINIGQSLNLSITNTDVISAALMTSAREVGIDSGDCAVAGAD